MTAHQILLVEKDAVEAEKLKTQLTPFGYAISCCEDPADIGAALDGTTSVAMLVRVSSSKGTPPEIDEIARLHSEGRELPPVIFLSDEVDFETRLAALKAGAKAYFARPVGALDLVDTLDLLAEQRDEDPFRVLIVEDDELSLKYFEAALGQAGIDVLAVTDPTKALEALSDFRPELILLDLYMPQVPGKELVAVIRQEAAFLSIPIVFISAEDDKAKQLEVMRIGADDFLTKPIGAEHLVSAVTIRAQRFRQLRSLMLRDSLTGLLNHTTSKEQLGIELSRMRRLKQNLAFALIDLDHFKSVNDTYGHQTGDQVLKTLSSLLK